jgi:hypothetical protein
VIPIAPSVAEVLEWARSRCASGRITAELDRFLDSPDPEDRKWALQVGMSYGVGLPGKRPEEHPTEVGSLIREAAARAREEIAEAPEPARAPQPLISAGAPEPEEAPAREPEPAAANAPPTPVEPAEHPAAAAARAAAHRDHEVARYVREQLRGKK